MNAMPFSMHPGCTLDDREQGIRNILMCDCKVDGETSNLMVHTKLSAERLARGFRALGFVFGEAVDVPPRDMSVTYIDERMWLTGHQEAKLIAACMKAKS